MINNESGKVLVDFDMDLFRMESIIENEKEKLTYVCDVINDLAKFLNQQFTFLEEMKNLCLGMDVSEQRNRIENSINLLEGCIDSLEIGRCSYDAMLDDAKMLLKVGCDMPRAF